MKMMIRQRRQQATTVHPADAIQLGSMAERGELETRLRWVHHMFFADEAAAREASRRIVAAGWNQDWFSAQPAPYQGWVLRAGRDVVINTDEVNEARAFFEALCELVGGSYGGWDVRRMPKHAALN